MIELSGYSRERPRDRRAAEQRNELAPFQLIELQKFGPASTPDWAAYRISRG
jgi:hypothetical protein